MSNDKKIKSALISVFYKTDLDKIVKKLAEQEVEIYSTGGTQKFIEGLGVKCKTVEGLTGYPSILGGRVKTLHPKVFGGILARRDNETDAQEAAKYEMEEEDFTVVTYKPKDNLSELVQNATSKAIFAILKFFFATTQYYRSVYCSIAQGHYTLSY